MSASKGVEISVIGGNISGLSAAYYLAKKGFTVTVYEPKIWNKPCGGAISLEFDHYLQSELGIHLEESDFNIPRMKVGLWTGRHVDVEGVFTVTTRYDLQDKITQRLKKEPNVTFVEKSVRPDDYGLFTKQTIIATGFTGLTHQILDRKWHPRDWATILRFDGKIDKKIHPNAHLIVLDDKLVGYGWVFFGKDNHVNIGLGGVGQLKVIWERYYRFFNMIQEKYGYVIDPSLAKPQGWGLPIPIDKWEYSVSTTKNGIEFIGVGDALGLAHPILGAGIEPGWQSGWLLSESVSSENIEVSRYIELLKANVSISSCRGLDRFMAKMMRSSLIPFKDRFGYVGLKLFMGRMIRKMREYPWYAFVSDGRKKTGFSTVGFNKSGIATTVPPE